MSEQEAYEAWFRGEQGKPYDGAYTFAEAAWHAALAWLRSQGEPVVWEIHTGPSRFYTRDKEEAERYAGNLYDVTPLYLAPQPAIPDGWQPIETAPKDELILVGPTKRMGVCAAMNHSRDGWGTETPSEWVTIYTPTHWMPLPAAPEPSK